MAVARQTTVGSWIVVNHNILRLCNHSLNFSQCHFCINQSAKGYEKKREKLVYVYVKFYQLCWCVVVVISFQCRLNFNVYYTDDLYFRKIKTDTRGKYMAVGYQRKKFKKQSINTSNEKSKSDSNLLPKIPTWVLPNPQPQSVQQRLYRQVEGRGIQKKHIRKPTNRQRSGLYQLLEFLRFQTI